MMQEYEIDGLLPNTRMTFCRDERDIGWIFTQTKSGVVLQKFKHNGDERAQIKLSPANIRTGSGLAAVKGGRTHPARLYYQDKEGFLREMMEHNDSWTTSDTKLLKMLPDTELAAVCWDGLDHIRVYYQDEQGVLREHCYDKDVGWHAGKKLNEEKHAVMAISAFLGEKGTPGLMELGYINIATNIAGKIQLHSYEKIWGVRTLTSNAAED